MRIRLKPLRDQTLVITGATSGIGLATARKAARQGARLVLAARNDDALNAVAEEVRQLGGQVAVVTADVGNEADVRRIADTAVQRFGGFDTWINNAGVSILGRLEDVSLQDHRRLFDTNYWGVVHGSLVALPHLRRHGGALINIGSLYSDRAIPAQGAESAAKHAVKGFTEALRMEVEQEAAPIAVTLIKPSATDTPYLEHAKSYLAEDPPRPLTAYSAELVADAVLHAAQHPMRDLTVGGGGRALALMSSVAPRLTDRLLERAAPRLPRPLLRASAPNDNLYAAGEDGRIQGDHSALVFRRSLYTTASRRPMLTAGVVVGTGLLLWGLFKGRDR